MKYYTDRVNIELTKKIMKAGMPIESYPEYMPECIGEQKTGPIFPMFAEVFDWLMEKGVYIIGVRRFDNWRWAYATEWRFRIELEDISQEEVNVYMVNGSTWHEAAENAIEKALTLI